MSVFYQPPTKKQKISPTKSCPRGSISQTSQTTKSTDQEPVADNKDRDRSPSPDDEQSPYHYALHINPDIILCSTDPELPPNTSWQIEHDDSIKPNLFIVKKAAAAYSPSKWLEYHRTQTNDIARAADLLC